MFPGRSNGSSSRGGGRPRRGRGAHTPPFVNLQHPEHAQEALAPMHPVNVPPNPAGDAGFAAAPAGQGDAPPPGGRGVVGPAPPVVQRDAPPPAGRVGLGPAPPVGRGRGNAAVGFGVGVGNVPGGINGPLRFGAGVANVPGGINGPHLFGAAAANVPGGANVPRGANVPGGINGPHVFGAGVGNVNGGINGPAAGFGPGGVNLQGGLNAQFGPAGRGRGNGRGVPPAHATIEALLASEGRILMPELHPHRENGAMWFGSDNAPRRVIVAAIRRHFDGAWFNISSVPNETIIQWWGEFIQAFNWHSHFTAIVYSYWYNITAARLRDMVSKAKNGRERPEWISLGIWGSMWEYWNSAEGKRRSRIAANNRMSNRDGFGPHAHTGGSRSFSQHREHIRRTEGVMPSILRVLRETHRRADGSYVDARAQYIDQEMQRQMAEASEESENSPGDGSGGSGLTQLQEDELYLKVVQPTQNGHVFGLGSQQPIRERGESSSMAATRIHLEIEVSTLREQLGTVLDYLKRFMDAEEREPNNSTTRRTEGTMASASGPVGVDGNHAEDSLEAARLLVNIGRGQPNHVPEAVGAGEEDQEDDNAPEGDHNGYEAA